MGLDVLRCRTGITRSCGREASGAEEMMNFCKLCCCCGEKKRETNRVPSNVRDLLESVVIWLILPVVICLSQRLSHACLSISTLYCETANGSLNQLSFI